MSSEGPAEAHASVMAAEAYALVPGYPRQALALALRAVDAGRTECDPSAVVAAHHAAAWAQVVLNDPAAISTLRTGIRVGKRADDSHGVALLRRLLATQLAWAGRGHAARSEIAAAISLLGGLDRARSQVHRLEVHRLSRVADPDEDRRLRADAGRALRVLRDAGDELWEAHLLVNRGLVSYDHGRLDLAETDFRRAETLYRRCGADLHAVYVLVLVANLEWRRGEVLACLRLLDAVERILPPGYINHNLVLCQANALAQVRLLPEAAAAAQAFVDLCMRTGRRDGVATTLLDLAAIAVLSRDPTTAHRLARKALRSFAAQGKPVNAALARCACLRAQLLDGTLRRSALRSGLEAAAILELAGWRRDSLRTHLLVARVALAVGSPAAARQQLELARPLARTGAVVDRVELCHARALLRAADGDRIAAERHLVEGLRLLDNYRAALGAAELRATASGIGSELAEAGLRLAIDSGLPDKILGWAERLRGNAILLPPVRPPADAQLRELQTALRRVGVRLRESEDRERIARGAARDQARIEEAIRRRMRLLDGTSLARAAPPSRREAAAALGERALVEYVELDGVLGAITLANGRTTFHDLGTDASLSELEWLRFALGRLARGGDRMQREASLANAEASAAALDRLLIEPVLAAVGDAPLVLVATGALHAVPWGGLPSLRGRAVTTAPSLSVWLSLAARPRSRRRKASIVAGPRLRHAGPEIRALAEALPGAAVLSGTAATGRATLAALEGAALAHVACHGRFRADSPLFSSLELADGPLNVYELQGLRRAPELVVLSACDLALSDRQPGDELLGLAAALLGMGTRTIIASVVPIPDAAAKRTMLAFHRNLAGGDAPASALAKAQARAAVPGFVCLGVG